MRLLVTGGLGTVGKPLTEELARRGHQVWVSDVQALDAPNYMQCDVGDMAQVKGLFSGGKFDCVYHLAAQFGRQRGEDFYENLWRTNVVGTKNMLRMQEQLKFHMVFTSTSEVYGDYRGVMREEVMEEVAIRQANDYAISKWVNEMQVMNSADSFGTETVRVRLFNNYGPGEHYTPYRSVICAFIYKALHDMPFVVYGKHKRTFTYIDDTVRTLANILENFRPGLVYNIAGEDLHDMKQVADLILKLTERNGSLVEYRDVEPATVLEKSVDASKAVRELGHRNTIGLEEGLRRTIQWQREVYGCA